MRLADELRGSLIVSCQPVVGGPLDRPDIVVGFALAALASGAAAVRIEGIDNVTAVRAATTAPIIGLIKRDYPGTTVRISATVDDIDALAAAGADIIAFDATGLSPSRPGRRPPRGDPPPRPHRHGRHFDRRRGRGRSAPRRRPRSARPSPATWRVRSRTRPTSRSSGPSRGCGKPVIAEGRIRTPEQAKAAIEAGAFAVVVGSAITRPEHITEWFATAVADAVQRRAA